MIRNLTFRWFFIMYVFLISLFTLMLSGLGIFLYRNGSIISEKQENAGQRLNYLAERTGAELEIVEKTMRVLLDTTLVTDKAIFYPILDNAMENQTLIRALYFLDSAGISYAVGTPDSRHSNHPDFLGIDFSFTPIYSSAEIENRVVWSDKFVSIFSGNTSIGAILKRNGVTVIAELSLNSLIETLETVADSEDRVWILDRKGELVADSQGSYESGIINARTIPFMQMAVNGRSVIKKVFFNRKSYYIKSTKSDKLGWFFIMGTPAGLENRSIYTTMIDILLIELSFIIFALIIYPFWTSSISSDIEFIRHQAGKIANGQMPNHIREGSVKEFKELSEYFILMYSNVLEREVALKDLNMQLEEKVQERTKELEERNNKVEMTLKNLNEMKDILVQTEKLAALGRLMAGVAHELNTPIGSTVKAIYNLREDQNELERRMETGFKIEVLETFLEKNHYGLTIAARNAEKASDLIKNFKDVTNDHIRLSREMFDLEDLIKSTIEGIKTPHEINIRCEEKVIVDSYPNIVIQIIKNLVNNSILHGLENSNPGTINISSSYKTPPSNVKTGDCPWIELKVEDNGTGIPEELGTKIFDPFFTNSKNSDSSGLGLYIVYNSVTTILGGVIEYNSIEGGTTFLIRIPIISPRKDETDC